MYPDQVILLLEMKPKEKKSHVQFISVFFRMEKNIERNNLHQGTDQLNKDRIER